MGAFLLPLAFALFSCAAGLDTDETAPIQLHATSVAKCPCDDNKCVLDLEGLEMMVKGEHELAFKSKMVINDNSCDKLSGEIQLKYCDKDGSNCFDQQPFPIPDLCAHLDDKNTIWETLIKKMEDVGFIPKCPVKEATYELKDVNVSIKPIEQYRPEPGRWTGKFVAFCEKKNIFCILMEVLVQAVGLK